MQNSTPTAENAIAIFRRLFANREDVVAIFAPWKKPCPVSASGQLDELLRAHVEGDAAPSVSVDFKRRTSTGAVNGRFRIGMYGPDLDGNSHWTCLDFDGAGHSAALADPLKAATDTHAALERAGIPAYLEMSGSGRGWHIWIFFAEGVPARIAREIGLLFVPDNAPLASGGLADPASGKGIEVFPKQEHVTKQGYGNFVWLPWWSGAPAGANLFYQVGVDGTPVAHLPQDFATVEPELVHQVLELARVDADARAGNALPAADPERWKSWRQQALAALPLEDVYGSFLTGQPGSTGWLECRDPASPSGDRNPSASVADGNGQAERGSFHSFRSGVTVSVFDYLINTGRARDIGDASAQIARLSGVPLPSSPPVPPGMPAPAAGPAPSGLPKIRVNDRQLRDIICDASRALVAANDPPRVFVRAGSMVRLVSGEEAPRIEPFDEAATYGHLARIADWIKTTPKGIVNVHPVREVAVDLLAYPEPALPLLEDVVTVPVFDALGNLVRDPGYQPAARLWLHQLPGFTLDPVPFAPTPTEIDAARLLLLDDLLVDFPFVKESDRAHALAALFLPFIRRMVSGCTPLHLFEAPTPGSGKGMLADVISLVARGQACEATTITADEDEARKKITSLLMRAPTIILLDNIKDGLDSAQLASAITTLTWTDRLLGQSRMLELPNKATWLVTANNPRLSMEVARRCVRVRIDPKVDRPWERTGFKHEPLKPWIVQNRARLVHAILLIVTAWITAGRPQSAKTLGSFEGWAAVLGGILEFIGVSGFLEDTGQLYDAADAEGQEWREFAHAWWDRFGGQWVSSGQLLTLATQRDLLMQTVGDKGPRSQAIRLGKALSSSRDRQFGDLRLIGGQNTNTKAAQYRLQSVSGTPAPACPATRGPDPAPPRQVTILDLAMLDEAWSGVSVRE